MITLRKSQHNVIANNEKEPDNSGSFSIFQSVFYPFIFNLGMAHQQGVMNDPYRT
jgi:hypothetical protein